MADNAASTGGKRVWTVSNVITICRILLVPVFVAALLAPWPEWFGLSSFDGGWKPFVAAGVFVLISCTDWLDGYLARSRDEVTDFGKFMDPLADKILVCAALISLVELGQLPTWVVLIILAREFIVSGVRMMAASKGVVIAASMLGKFKTVFQMVAIVLFTIKDSHMIGDFSAAIADKLWLVSWLVMFVALGLTIASLIDYLYKGREILGFSAAQGASEVQAADGQPGADAASSLAVEVVESALGKGLTIATAESLTGGMIGSTITAVSGSSSAFRGGVISYTNEVKNQLLKVDGNTLATDGAVCESTAVQMARGALDALKADIAVSVTGIAGPTGAEPGKPVGTVWIGIADRESASAREFHFSGNREDVRRQTVEKALETVLRQIQSHENGNAN